MLPQLEPPTNTNSTTNPDDTSWYLTESQGGVVGSMLALGSLLSALPAGYLAERFGRKSTLISLTLPFTVNWLLIVFANGPTMLYIGRFFSGVAAGAMCVCAPMYIGEIAEASIRGALGSFFQMFICTGILTAYVFGSIFTWRVLSLVLAMVPFIFAAAMTMMPETPIFLVKIGDKHRAKLALQYFRGPDCDVDEELRSMEADVEKTKENTGELSKLISTRGNRKALIAGIGIMMFQQLSGINAVIFYTIPIFQSAGSNLSSNLAAIVVAVVQLVFAYVSVMVIERANRRFYLKLSAIGMASCSAALGMYFHLKTANVTFPGLGILPVGSLVLFIVAFSMGFGPVPWMIMSELFAPEIKEVASGLAIMTNWMFTFVVTFSFPLMKTYLGSHVTFYIFCVIMVCGTAFVHVFVPETRGKTLKEIQTLLNK